LPNRIAAKLAEELGIEDLTPQIGWASAKPSVKETAVNKKWSVLEEVGLNVSEQFKNRDVLIIDVYQSGTTVHFIASKLREAGCGDIHCLAVVKALGDTDNV
jgi:predicted amidophosphoribosyltransferase